MSPFRGKPVLPAGKLVEVFIALLETHRSGESMLPWTHAVKQNQSKNCKLCGNCISCEKEVEMCFNECMRM